MIILRPSIHDERSEEEGPTYHGIVRYTHVRCGYTTRIRGEMEILNDLDPACPRCMDECKTLDHESDGFDCDLPWGEVVWELGDGTLTLTTSNGSELTLWQPIRTHLQIYKSWTNAPDTGEWWVVPRPNTGDIDGSDNLIVGFDTYQQAIDAVNSGDLRTTFAELCTDQDGIAWRDRNNPIYTTGYTGCTSQPGTYRLHYVSADGPGDNAPWSVYSEEYPSADHDTPIEGSTRKVSTHPTEWQARSQAERLQKGA